MGIPQAAADTLLTQSLGLGYLVAIILSEHVSVLEAGASPGQIFVLLLWLLVCTKAGIHKDFWPLENVFILFSGGRNQ